MNTGCYGSVFCNDEQNKICGSCNVYLACHEVANSSMGALRKKLNVEHLARKFEQARIRRGVALVSQPVISGKRGKLTAEQKLLVANEKFPVKARKMVASIFKKGIDGIFIRRMLMGNSNPFRNATPAVMEAGCDLLINGSLTMRNMSDELMKRSDYSISPNTASSQSSTVIMALVIIGVVVPRGKDYVLRRR